MTVRVERNFVIYGGFSAMPRSALHTSLNRRQTGHRLAKQEGQKVKSSVSGQTAQSGGQNMELNDL